MSHAFSSVYCQSSDGLKIHARSIGPAGATTLPVLCLPGLTRTTDDFDVLASALANDASAPRRVVAIDYRGRGLSDYDPDPAKYAVPVEAGDVQAVAASLGISKAILLGTSRGGIIAMLLAMTKPDLLAGVVLNDVGPALEMTGLLRIKSYIGDRTFPANWDVAARRLRALFGRNFPNLTDEDWMAWARRGFREVNGKLQRTYDTKLSGAFDGIDRAKPPPPAWKLFDAMKNVPLMLIHGGLSDLLSEQGVKDMQARRPDLDVVEVADQGHAPLLAETPTIKRIAAFCARCDAQT